jgi:hypothetical protein
MIGIYSYAFVILKSYLLRKTVKLDVKASELEESCVWMSDAGVWFPLSAILKDEGCLAVHLPLLYDIASNTSVIWLGF